MDANERIIHGMFTNRDETIQEIRRLNEEGYTRENITVYSNSNDDFESYDASERNPKREEGSFDAMETKPKDEEGSFDKTDEDSRERSEEGSFDRVDRRNRSNDRTDESDTSDDDDSVWESVKDFFTPDTYDYEKESQKSDYDPDQDILYPYREDLSRGHHVVVLNNQNIDGAPGRL